MLNKNFYPESLVTRRAICTAIAMFVAVLTDRYYSMLQGFWVCLTTILVLQMTVRSNFRIEALRFFVIFASVFFATILVLTIHQPVVLYSVIVLVFVVGCFLHCIYANRSSGFSPFLMVALLTLMMLVPYTPIPDLLFARLHDVVLGGLIGMIAARVIFPMRADIDFRMGIIPLLTGYSDYLSAIGDVFFQEQSAEKSADEKKSATENIFQTRRPFFPEWVYDVGFNSNLREGHRHFLLRVEQIGEILFALHHHARHPIEPSLLDIVRKPVLRCILDAKSSIADIVVVLEKADFKSTYADFATDVNELENIFNTKIAMPFELADTAKDYMQLAGFIYDIKDLQQVLAKLEEALRDYISRVDID